MPMMPPGMPPRGMPPKPQGMPQQSNNPIDDLISAQMMQSAVGNPNAPVPTGKQAGRQQRPAIPVNRQPKSSNPQQAMITEIFRKQGGAPKTQKKANAGPPSR